jgi:TPR repeat protein
MRRVSITLLLAGLLALPLTAQADYARGKQAFDKKNYKAALAELTPESRRGNLDAAFLLGRMYAEELGVARDDQRAFELFEKAANAGHAGAQGMMGMFYAQGRGGAQRDNAKSVEWTRKAAENGDPLSQYMMGVRSIDGLGIPRSPEDAVAWFGGAAEQNYALAQYALGVLLGFGPQARGEAAHAQELRAEAGKWLLLAAKQKSPDVPNAQAKYDELKKEMGPKEVAVANERAAKWRPVVKAGRGADADKSGKAAK